MPRTFLAILILGIGSAACGAAPRPGTPAPNAAEAAQPPDETRPDGHAHHGELHHHEAPAADSLASKTDGTAARREARPHGAHSGEHRMWMRPLGAGWQMMGMAQAIPIVTVGSPFDTDTPLHRTEWVLTQPAAMFNLESPGQRFVLRTTLNFEGLTLRDGELTPGGWGEGFIDLRHPHTLLHEAMLSVNLWEVAGGALSISGGKGFAPYGTDDPMARPALKYPTNHHLSQILERWTLNGIYLRSGWSIEAGIFGGTEPTGPYDLSNIRSFADSWSARVVRRFGEGWGPEAAWELSASFASVHEVHDQLAEDTRLINLALRHSRGYGFGRLYGLLEASRSRPEHVDGYFSILGETQLIRGLHQPYYRVEYATRPEFVREGAAGEYEFFRYNFATHPVGGTRWRIHSVGYAHELAGPALTGVPFIEAQHHRVWWDHGLGAIAPERLFNTNSFWGLSAGVRLYLGGGPMRMGAYGILDAMTASHRREAPEVHHHDGEHHPDGEHSHH